MWKLSFALVLLVSHTYAQAPRELNSEQNRILALEVAWNQAVQEKDQAALALLISPELVYIDYDGSLMNRREYVASVLSHVMHVDHIANESIRVNVYGEAAVVTAVYHERGQKKGKHYDLRERFTDTWVRQNGGWKCVASESTLLP